MALAQVIRKELRFLDLTILTVEWFEQIVPLFEEILHERMKYFRLDGKPRVGREYQTYVNCPLPTLEDRLLFILVYMKNNPLQVLPGELFGMPQEYCEPVDSYLIICVATHDEKPWRCACSLTGSIGQAAGLARVD